MSDDITLKLSAVAMHRTLGKIIGVVLGGLVIGLWYHQSMLDDIARGRQLTLEKYTADFAVYKAHLMEHTWAWWGDVAMVIVMLAIMFVAYELLGLWIAWLLAHLRGREDTEIAPAPPATPIV